ncbi:cysteine hydrolase family protein [Segeticoccus rhizosphaerae]|uniref:cysteine hydrolase family protein n=1 Tax=Segeticoccus rhizosphaerae TaxID=1104777 RepID=UPI0012654DF8|nr:cysteine hydrolase [Segeticoccus rhizosphaerae]
MTSDAALVVIDMQVVFADSGSPWGSTDFGRVQRGVQSLVAQFEDSVVFTRFVPPQIVEGSWLEYYRRWKFVENASPEIWELVAPWQARRSVALPTFSKWGADLEAEIAADSEIVLCGVATDCCVLATAFAAIDAGRDVRVVADACGGGSVEQQKEALNLMSRRFPQLTMTTVAEVIGEGWATPLDVNG